MNALLSAALALPGLGLANDAAAQTPPEAPTVRIRYSNYQEYQAGKENRMKIHAPMAMLDTPIGENNRLEATYVFDGMSGASPYYLDSLSGASGTGIHDTRRAGDMKFTHYFKHFSVGLGGRVSDEEDYLSRGGLVDARVWTPDKNTTFSLGFSFDSDDISSTQSPDFGDDRRSQGYLFGITQILTPNSALQSNLTFSHGRGYHSDPYKPFDNRPRSREGWSWLSRYILYFPEMESSLHADYRFFIDSWGIKSHMLEVAWYQPFGTAWMFRPSVRYYTQSAAQFFQDSYPPQEFGDLYSADQRMGDFGSIGAGLKLIRELGRGFSADIAFEAFLQKPELKLGGDGYDNIKDFYAGFLSVGLSKKF
jgi:hypothetical protein